MSVDWLPWLLRAILFSIVGLLLFLRIVEPLLQARRERRLRRLAKQPMSRAFCPACGTADLSIDGPDSSRCNACGLAWGKGLRARQANARRGAYARLSLKARVATAIDSLETAISHLDSAIHLFRNGRGSDPFGVIVVDVLYTVLADGYGSPTDEDTIEDRRVLIEREVGLAKAHIRYAREAWPDLSIMGPPFLSSGVTPAWVEVVAANTRDALVGLRRQLAACDPEP